MTTETLSIADAEALIAAALRGAGASDAQAVPTARALVAAEAEGQVGHGFSRVADYAAQVASGKVRGDARPACDASRPTALIVDAGHGFAYPALDLAVARMTEAALTHGTASAGITRSHHCGALSVQVDRIAQAGCIGLMTANAPAAIAPWGARTPVFGTNPIAFAVPRRDAPPLVIDLSLSRVARGKVMHAKKTGQPIPEGWALDREGQPTTDPVAALAGTMLPIGEAKGTALALMVEILAAAVPQANLSTEASSFFDAEGPPPGTGQFLLALAPSGPGVLDRLETLLATIAAAEGARLPGTRRIAALARAQSEGLTVPAAYVAAARDLAARDQGDT